MKPSQVVAAQAHRKVAFKRSAVRFRNAEDRLMAAPIGDAAAIYARKQLLDILVIQAQDRSSVEGNFLDEFEKRRADLVNRCVMIQVLAIDIGNNRQNGAELEKRPVALV